MSYVKKQGGGVDTLSTLCLHPVENRDSNRDSNSNRIVIEIEIHTLRFKMLNWANGG